MNRGIVAVAITGAITARASAQAEFERLGYLSGGGSWSDALGVSADGSSIAGYSDTGATTYNGFRWTAAAALENTGRLSGAEDWSYSAAISPDGSYCAGGGRTQDDSYWQWHATLFDGTGILDLGTLPYVADGWSHATDVSNQGEYVVGYADHGDGYHTRAFRWSAASGMVAIDPVGAWNSTLASAISPDGTTVVGTMTAGSSADDRAFLWTEANGLLDLGGQAARGISPDGTMVLGLDDSAHAAWWTAADGWVSLPWTDARYGVGAVATCADHGVIVGYDGYHGYYWTPQGGTRWIENVLAEEHGVDLAGWVPFGLTGLSDDGTVISGWAYEAANTNHVEAFRAVVPRTPFERMGYALAGSGGVEPQLYGRGDLAAGGRGFLAVEQARGNSAAVFIVGLTAIYAPLFKGTLVPAFDLLVPVVTGWYGDVAIGGDLPSSLPPGIEFYAQTWIADPGGPKHFSATNAVKGVTQ